ncbi:hypothetical protein [Haloarchaeobius sp. FL176]|uniref:hypothetical protein n=1 Tax=Haloarchaeobius sp. FL176 TaxID=2967129 RepID=UPI0021491AFB|nr:hypothetical protein [Haloarchaeobius sp. FL176]
MKVCTGEWRVLGTRSDGRTMLVHPLFETEIPAAVRVGEAVAVSTTNYGGELQGVVDELDPGNRVRAGVYPGTPGRFTTVERTDDQRLVLGFRPTRTPDFVVSLWNEAAAGHAGDGPVAASRSLSIPEGTAEVYVAQSAARDEDDLWWAFVGGSVEESFFDSFDTAPGRPAEFVAGNPANVPYFWVVKFSEHDTQTARQLAIAAGLVGQDVDIDAELAELADGLGGKVVA